MKTYTIRPLEWKITAGTMLFAETFAGDYTIRAAGSGKLRVDYHTEYSTEGVPELSASQAAAKQLAWQDWLRRITPALEEIK